jgi:glycolate oxidase FAD binding subunit
LIVRLQGGNATVAAEHALLERHAGVPFRTLQGEEAKRLFEEARDRGGRGGLVLRATALPWRLSELLTAVEAALPGSEVSADVMAGRLYASAAPDDAEPGRLAELRASLMAAGGAMTVVTAPPAFYEALGAAPASPGVAALSSSLKLRFDPDRILSPGRFVS